jgi:hypothetical protein
VHATLFAAGLPTLPEWLKKFLRDFPEDFYPVEIAAGEKLGRLEFIGVTKAAGKPRCAPVIFYP